MSTELSLATGFDDEGGPIAPRLAMIAAAGYRRPLNFEINMKSQSRPAPEFLAELFRAGSGLAARHVS